MSIPSPPHPHHLLKNVDRLVLRIIERLYIVFFILYVLVVKDCLQNGECWDIYMDSMAFGMGMCCLQTTFQCQDINEARKFYDQLAVVCPIMVNN